MGFSQLKKSAVYAIKGIFVVWLCTTCLMLGCSTKSVTITIKPIGNQMKYETISFSVQPKQKVTIIMDNIATVAVMKHNVVILNDKKAIQAVGIAALTAPNNIPTHPAIIAATPIAAPGEKTQVTFTAPATPGDYVYICTFPGHYITMQGTMRVE